MKGGKGDRNKEGKEEAYSVYVWGGVEERCKV